MDVRIVRKSSFDKFVSNQNKFRDYEFAYFIDRPYVSEYFEYLSESKSQLRQDLFVLSELRFKRDGYFVEFGATNGIDLSNSHLLETRFGWQGILAEPARIWHKALKNNRKVNRLCMENVWR